MQLRDYFDKELQRHFRAQIPALRATLGRIPKVDLDHTYGVGGNTYRALGGFSQAPSPVFRTWAQHQLDAIDHRSIQQNAATRKNFVAWHASLVNSLDLHWKTEMNDQLSFAHSRKLVDLFIKWLCFCDFGTVKATELLIKHANCALDRQTLSKLNACLSGALPISKPSMGHVSSQNTYSFCQDAIGEFAESCEGTRLLFDCFGWRPGG